MENTGKKGVLELSLMSLIRLRANLSLWIESMDWVYGLSLWIESMDWVYGLSVWFESVLLTYWLIMSIIRLRANLRKGERRRKKWPKNSHCHKRGI